MTLLAGRMPAIAEAGLLLAFQEALAGAFSAPPATQTAAAFQDTLFLVSPAGNGVPQAIA